MGATSRKEDHQPFILCSFTIHSSIIFSPKATHTQFSISSGTTTAENQAFYNMAVMSISTIVGLLALKAACFQVASSQKDGMYTAYLDTNGTEVHSHHANITDILLHHSQRRTPVSEVEKRTADSVYCANNAMVVNSIDLSVARLTLGASCDAGGDNFIPKKNGVRYVKTNDLVVFTCNYAPNDQHCTSDELNDDISAVQKQCANSEGEPSPLHSQTSFPSNELTSSAGYYDHYDWAKTYGYAKAGSSFC